MKLVVFFCLFAVIHAGQLGPQIKRLKTRSQQQACDLVCPGRPPQPLPPDFLEGCSPAGGSVPFVPPQSAPPPPPPPPRPPTTGQNSTTPPKPTTKPPGTGGTNSTESSEESDESTESSQNGTKRLHKARLHHKTKKLNHKSKHFRKQKIFLKQKGKEMLKHYKNKMSNRSGGPDGCHVVCSDDPQGGGYDGFDDDYDFGPNYGGGYDDPPIDIIFVPSHPSFGRPSDIYNINNYGPPHGFNPPPPPMYGPMIWQDKSRVLKHKEGRKH